jgi:hypothetical protein
MAEGVAKGKGRSVQARKARKDGWTDERRQIFLDHLASCCNVRRSAAAAEMSPQAAYGLRNRDAEFAGQWDEALGTGYAALESMLLERAAGPQRGYEPGEVPDAGEVDSALALDLLRLRGAHRRAGARADGPKPRKAGADELAEAILAKLDVLERRLRRKR